MLIALQVTKTCILLKNRPRENIFNKLFHHCFNVNKSSGVSIFNLTDITGFISSLAFNWYFTYSMKHCDPVVNNEQVYYLKKIKKESLTNAQSEKDNQSENSCRF